MELREVFLNTKSVFIGAVIDLRVGRDISVADLARLELAILKQLEQVNYV